MAHGILGSRPRPRWAMGEQAKSHLYLESLTITHITTWVLLSVRSAGTLDSNKSVSPIVNCTSEGSRLCTPYENHPKTIPLALFMENLSSTKPPPGANKIGDHCCKVYPMTKDFLIYTIVLTASHCCWAGSSSVSPVAVKLWFLHLIREGKPKTIKDKNVQFAFYQVSSNLP